MELVKFSMQVERFTKMINKRLSMKLIKIIILIKNNCKDSLRYLVQDSLVNYTQMVVDSCWQVIDIKDSFEWPEADLINSTLRYIFSLL